MSVKSAIATSVGVLLLAGLGAPAFAQAVPSCKDPEVFAAAAEAVTGAHTKSNFAGLGADNKVIGALKFMMEYEPPRQVQPTIEMLAARAGYGPENIRACMTSEWIFNQRALVFIMLSPDNPEEWGLFMVNVALDVPVATGWVMEPAPE